jgi:hypothetical protein
MSSSIAAYQTRLRALVDEAKGRKGLRDLARRMGDENLRTSISYWLKEELSQPLRPGSYEALAKIDPQGRNASELEYWLRTGKELPNVECVPQPALVKALLTV